MLQLKKFPDIPVSTREEAQESRPRRAPVDRRPEGPAGRRTAGPTRPPGTGQSPFPTAAPSHAVPYGPGSAGPPPASLPQPPGVGGPPCPRPRSRAPFPPTTTTEGRGQGAGAPTGSLAPSGRGGGREGGRTRTETHEPPGGVGGGGGGGTGPRGPEGRGEAPGDRATGPERRDDRRRPADFQSSRLPLSLRSAAGTPRWFFFFFLECFSSCSTDVLFNASTIIHIGDLNVQLLTL